MQEALGPRAQVGALSVGLRSLSVHDLHLAAAPGWPAEDELHARLVTVQPDLASLFGGPWRLNRIHVEGGRISLLRTRDGRLRVLPGVLERPAAPLAAAAPTPTPTPTPRRAP